MTFHCPIPISISITSWEISFASLNQDINPRISPGHQSTGPRLLCFRIHWLIRLMHELFLKVSLVAKSIPISKNRFYGARQWPRGLSSSLFFQWRGIGWREGVFQFDRLLPLLESYLWMGHGRWPWMCIFYPCANRLSTANACTKENSLSPFHWLIETILWTNKLMHRWRMGISIPIIYYPESCS